MNTGSWRREHAAGSSTRDDKGQRKEGDRRWRNNDDEGQEREQEMRRSKKVMSKNGEPSAPGKRGRQ